MAARDLPSLPDRSGGAPRCSCRFVTRASERSGATWIVLDQGAGARSSPAHGGPPTGVRCRRRHAQRSRHGLREGYGRRGQDSEQPRGNCRDSEASQTHRLRVTHIPTSRSDNSGEAWTDPCENHASWWVSARSLCIGRLARLTPYTLDWPSTAGASSPPSSMRNRTTTSSESGRRWRRWPSRWR